MSFRKCHFTFFILVSVLTLTVIASLSSCGRQNSLHNGSGISSVSPDTVVENSSSDSSFSDISPDTAAGSSVCAASGSYAADVESGSYTDTYPYDIASDKASFDDSDIDIVVGDHLYMTQINDWFTNFDDYDGKTVEIEGYYLNFNGYQFVGRNGPTCPYCTGGYVDFEFQTDKDLSSLTSENSWIKVTGILRKGYTSYTDPSKPKTIFFYIETMKLEVMPKPGLGTITD